MLYREVPSIRIVQFIAGLESSRAEKRRRLAWIACGLTVATVVVSWVLAW